MISVSQSQSKQDAGLQAGLVFGAVCTSLEAVLVGGVDIHRCLAAKALGQIHATSSVQLLIKALLDEDEDVRSDAAEALLKLADPESGQQLMQNLLGDPCTEVKLSAIATLARLGDQRVIPWLQRMVRGRDPEIAWNEEEFHSSGWDDWVEIQVGAIEALAELNAVDTIPDIIAAICHDDAQDLAEVAFKSLARMGSQGLKALAEFLDVEDTRLRRRAAARLASIDSDEVNEALIKAIADPSSQVRSAVLKARVKMSPDDPLLVKLLEDDDVGIRADAALLIGSYYPDILRVLLDDPPEIVRRHTINAIAYINADQIDDVLVERLSAEISSHSPDISVAASSTLAVIAPHSALEILSDLLGNISQPLTARLGALKGLIAIGGDEVVTALLGIVDDEQRQMRLEAMSALANLAAADDNWPNIAGSTLLTALGGGYDPEEEPREVDLISDEQHEREVEEPKNKAEFKEPVRVEVIAQENFPVSTLDSILNEAPGMAPAVGLPQKGIELSRTDMERLAIAKRVIGKKKVKVEPKVTRHDDIRRFAARVLGNLDKEEVIEALAVSLDTGDTETCLAAADSLARICARGVHFSSNVVETIYDNLSTDNLSLKLSLIRALSGCDSDKVVDQLKILLGDVDSSVRIEAIRALSGSSQLEEKAEVLLTDPEPFVRLNAAKAIAADANSENLEKLVDFSFSFEGYHGRRTAALLRKVDKERANTAFLNVLDDPDKKRVWSIAIEALEELNQ